MADNHYYLQYHLYGLALDRLLAQRLGERYVPEEHLGEVFYVFLRGVDPAVPGSGVLADRFTPARLAALRRAFGPATPTPRPMIAQHFAEFLGRQHRPEHDDFGPLVRALSEAVSAGSSCLEIDGLSDRDAAGWREILDPDGEASAVASPGGHAPLILTVENKLYLQRYFLHEKPDPQGGHPPR